jgi:hypothetical protein
MGWTRLVAVVASSSLLSCGLVFPTDDLVAGDGGPNGGGEGGSSGGPGALTLSMAPDCTSTAPKDSVTLAGNGEFASLGSAAAYTNANVGWSQGGGTNSLDASPVGASGSLHFTWTTAVNDGQPTQMQGKLTLPDGTVLCAGEYSMLEATTDQKGAIFLLQNITKGASCPAPPAQSTTSQIVGCVVFVI